MSTSQAPKDLLKHLKTACRGGRTALRAQLELEPAGGQADKVFPPTYEDGQYVKERRNIAGREVDCVLLDSVQSQANRLESALLEAWEADEVTMPMVSVEIPGYGKSLTALEAPHRIADAIFRDCELDGVAFRASDVGKAVFASRISNATTLFEVCPTALLFGMWDSHGGQGVRAAKFQRAIVSELVGFEVITGKRSGGRIDPLGIEKGVGDIYKTSTGEWTLDVKEAEGKRPKSLKPSEIGHGNIAPSVSDGGVTMAYARQTVVLSFAQLRRMRFPVNGEHSKDRDVVARTMLALLGLFAVAAQAEQGYDLRSRCLLIPTQHLTWELLGSVASETEAFSVASEVIAEAIAETATELDRHGLRWGETITLTPSPSFVTLLARAGWS